MTIIEAIKSGKEHRAKGTTEWIIPDPNNDYSPAEILLDYEIKEEPMVFWVNVYPNIITINKTKEEADSVAENTRIKCIKVVEVAE